MNHDNLGARRRAQHPRRPRRRGMHPVAEMLAMTAVLLAAWWVASGGPAAFAERRAAEAEWRDSIRLRDSGFTR